MINSENIIITIILLYSLYALIMMGFYEKKISLLEKENNQLKKQNKL